MVPEETWLDVVLPVSATVGAWIRQRRTLSVRFVRSPLCLFCREVDTTEHAFFKCKMFNGESSYLDQRWGPVTPDNVVEKMSDIKCWNDIEEYAKAVVASKDTWRASVV